MLGRDRYRQLVDQSPDGILLTQDTRITFVNLAAVRLLGATGAEQVVGRSLFDFFRPKARRSCAMFSRGSCPTIRSCHSKRKS